MSDPELEKLLDQLINGDLTAQIKASLALSQFGDVAVEPLIGLLKNPATYNSWRWIAVALGQIGDSRAVEPLVAVLKSPISFDAGLARKYTAEALGQLKDPRAVDALLTMLNERIHDEEEDGYIVDEPDHETIQTAIWALTEIGESRAIEPIIRRILEGHYQQGSTLTPWGDAATRILIETLQDEDENKRRDAASLLGEFGDVKAVKPLIERLRNDKSDRVRHSAAYALGELADPRAYESLLAALNDPYEQTRAFAAMGLGKLKDKRAVDALRKAAQDEHQLVRNMANWSLEWIENN